MALLFMWLWSHLVSIDLYPQLHTFGISAGLNSAYASLEVVSNHLALTFQHLGSSFPLGDDISLGA